MPNIQLNYLYRDGANYKNHGAVIFSNPNNKSLEEVNAAITGALHFEEPWFYANEWALPDLHFTNYKWDDEIDHSFHEFESVEYTDKPVTDARTIAEFLGLLTGLSRE